MRDVPELTTITLATKDSVGHSRRNGHHGRRRGDAHLARSQSTGSLGLLTHGSEPIEAEAGCFELHQRALFVARRTVRVAQAHAGERRLVGRADLVPEVRSSIEIPAGAGRVAGCQLDASVRERCAGRERLAFERCGDARELAGCGLREAQIAGRDRDLGLRLEERRLAKLGVRRKLLGRDRERMLERVANGIGGERDVALREVHEREAGLRVPANLVRRAKGLLRARMSPLRRRIRPSSMSGQPNSRRR